MSRAPRSRRLWKVLKDLSKFTDIPAVRIFDIVGIPKATAEKKVAAKEPISGAGGQAAGSQPISSARRLDAHRIGSPRPTAGCPHRSGRVSAIAPALKAATVFLQNFYSSIIIKEWKF